MDLDLKDSFFAKLAFFWQNLRKYRHYVFGIIALEVVLGLLNAIIPYFTKLQIDELEKHSTQLFFLHDVTPVTIFVILLLIPAFIELIRLVFFEKIDKKLSTSFTTELQLNTERMVWEKLESLDAGFFENQRNQRILDSATSSTKVVSEFFTFLRTKTGQIVTIFAIFPLLALVSWQLLILVAVVTVLQLLLSEVSRKQEVALTTLSDKQGEEYWKFRKALAYSFHELRILGATQHFLAKYQELAHQQNLLDFKRQTAREIFRTYEWVLNNGLIILANLFVGYEVLQGRLTLGTFTLVVSYTLQINNIFRNVLDSVQGWRDIDLQLDRLRFFALLQPRITQSAHPITQFQDLHSVVFQDVHFTYPDLFVEEKAYIDLMVKKTEGFLRKFSSYYYQFEFDGWKELLKEETKKPVLNGVNLNLQRGKIMALLGRNGAGKTTITHLLMHHYEPTRGEVLLNGRPLYEYRQNELLQQFGVIQQRPFILYRFTVRENLLLGVHREITDAEIWQLLEKLEMKKTIQDFSKKLETILGEDVSLSGGQEQLLAVARVLLQKRPFLIFDEGMNQMDIEHETLVMNLLKEQAKNAAILFITHRITTARKADHIYMLDKGVVAEEGTHEVLLKKDGLYAKFWNMQVIN